MKNSQNGGNAEKRKLRRGSERKAEVEDGARGVVCRRRRQTKGREGRKTEHKKGGEGGRERRCRGGRVGGDKGRKMRSGSVREKKKT